MKLERPAVSQTSSKIASRNSDKLKSKHSPTREII